ncbi:MAG TPA: S24 family peptidase [Gemmatimonadaceae bacterium]|jgi:phage repressor protein C with HTH and peptisase S24 domain|nr:S24 family peptidase [Gemmatimonadaceae bacterium]
MDSHYAEEDAIARLLGEHMLTDPVKFPLDERVAAWAALQAASRQTRDERTETEKEATNWATRIRYRMIAQRLEHRLPVSALTPHRALVRGRTSMVRKAAHEIRQIPLVETAVAAGEGSDLLDEVSETWVELPAKIPRGDYIAVPVVGDSMEPLLHKRDVVLVKLGSDVARDTVIVARKNDGYVVKYVSKLSEREIELSSLESSYPPFTVPRLESRVVGTVIARLRRS